MPMFGAPTPILRSFDEGRAKAFYLEFLGFELVFEHRFEDWAPLYMGVKKGDCLLHLSEHYGDGTPGSSVRIPVDNVKAYMAELRQGVRQLAARRAAAAGMGLVGDHHRRPCQ